MKNEFLHQFSELQELVRIINDVIKRQHKEAVPSVNLLCAVGLDENANSRILKALLSHSYKGKYYILESFVREFMSESFTEEIVAPAFSNEEGRIDLLIKEPHKYAIICENKIQDAVMQKNQLARYIERERKEGYDDKQIYIVFLPSTEEGEPTECGWKLEASCCYGCEPSNLSKCKNKKSLKAGFKERFYKIDFKESILNWLKLRVMPECRLCEPTLHSALNQYIDYLETYFKLNTNSTETNMAISQAIKDHIGIMNDEIENMNIIHDKIKEAKLVMDELKSIESELCTEFFTALTTKLQEAYGQELHIEQKGSTASYRITEMRVQKMIGGYSCYPVVGIDKGSRIISCGLNPIKADNGAAVSNILGQELRDFRLKNKYQKGHDWVVYKYIKPSEAYSELCKLIEFCDQHK